MRPCETCSFQGTVWFDVKYSFKWHPPIKDFNSMLYMVNNKSSIPLKSSDRFLSNHYGKKTMKSIYGTTIDFCNMFVVSEKIVDKLYMAYKFLT